LSTRPECADISSNYSNTHKNLIHFAKICSAYFQGAHSDFCHFLELDDFVISSLKNMCSLYEYMEQAPNHLHHRPDHEANHLRERNPILTNHLLGQPSYYPCQIAVHCRHSFFFLNPISANWAI